MVNKVHNVTSIIPHNSNIYSNHFEISFNVQSQDISLYLLNNTKTTVAPADKLSSLQTIKFTFTVKADDNKGLNIQTDYTIINSKPLLQMGSGQH